MSRTQRTVYYTSRDSHALEQEAGNAVHRKEEKGTWKGYTSGSLQLLLD